MMTNLMTILERKAFISSNPRIVLSSCPPPCGHFSIQESASGGLSYKARKKNPACRILRLRWGASSGNSPIVAVRSCPAGLSSVLILLKYCIHQFLCIRLFRLIDNSIRFPALHHFSVIQNQHLIAETLYKCKIMADKYKG